MMTPRRRRDRLSRPGLSWTAKQPRAPKRLSTRFLEGVIVALICLDAYLVYSVLYPSAGVSSRLNMQTPPPLKARVQVEVLNGCGETGLSQKTRSYLRAQGFDVVYIDNAEHFDFPETVVLDRSGTDTVSDAARAVAYALGTTHVILQRNDDRMVDVTVIIGHDYERLRFYEE